MQQFPFNAPLVSYFWSAPPGVTRVMVELWGAGGGGGPLTGGGAGAYSKSLIAVTPGTVYTIIVGGGGQFFVLGGPDAAGGATSSMNLAGNTLIYAGGGGPSGGQRHDYGTVAIGGVGDPNAAISHDGFLSTVGDGGSAFGASFCPNGGVTGHGGRIFEGGYPGYVLLVW